MKRILIFILLSIFLATIFTGCGDDDNNTTAPTPNDVENVDFLMSIMNMDDYDYGRDEEWMIMVSSMDYTTTISDISLMINDEVIELEYENNFGDFYYGTLYTEVGTELTCQLVINGTTADLQLQVPAYPEVDWPETYDPATVYDITWELQFDSQYQFLSGYGETYDWENWETIDEDENMLELSPSARFTNLPANWLEAGLEDYDLSLEEIFFDYDGKIAGIAAAIDTEYYWEYRAKAAESNAEMNLRQQKMLQIAKRLRQ